MNLLATLRRYLTLDDDPAILARAERLEDPSRRRFLHTALIGTAVAATVDLDQLLWTPRPMVLATDADLLTFGHSLWTPEVVRETLRILKNDLQVATLVSRTYDDDYSRHRPLSLTRALTF